MFQSGLLLTGNLAIAGEPETDWSTEASISAGYDDNVGRAERDRDIVSDTILLGSIGVAFRREFVSEKAITLRGFLESLEHREVSGLSRLTAGAQFVYRWQNVLGFAAPFYQFNTSVKFDEYDGKLRDATRFNTQILASKRIDDRILASTGLEYSYHEASGTVFDQKRSRWFLNADYSTRSGWALYGTYSFIHGDIASTSQAVFCDGMPAPDNFGLISWAEAIEPDEAFSSAFCGRWIAYRLSANTNMLIIGANKGVGPDMAFDISVSKVIVNGAGTNEYDRMIVNAAMLMRF